MNKPVTPTSNDLKSIFGFWVYLMTDCALFATLFATYAVLRNNTYGGEPARELFSLPYVLSETLILLVSSFTCGLMILAMYNRKKQSVLWMLALTFTLGAAFLGLELNEFANLANEGNSWTRSGFLSGFFTLVGTHGLHITVGLIWAATLGVYVYKKGIDAVSAKRLFLFSLFWHFLDVIWIFIFTFVFLMGAI